LQAFEKLRVRGGAALEIGREIRAESVVAGALTLVTRRQRMLVPGESLLVGEELMKGLAGRGRGSSVVTVLIVFLEER
jgi:hypothetical protein